jgi:macrolide-specific efflux system membrane fusion protein
VIAWPRSRKVWIVLALAALAAGVVALWLLQQSPVVPAMREVRVERGDLEVSIQATGTVRPRNRLEIKPPLAGRAEEVLAQEGQLVRRGQILAWMSSNERAALLDAARAQGEAEVKRWAELYRPTAVVSPIDGTVILRAIEPGQSFTTTDSLLVVADRLIVEAQVDETDIAQVRLHQPATIVLDAYPAQPIPAKVGAIAFESKTVNNVTTYTVDVLPEKVPSFMRSGMTSNVLFRVAQRQNVLWVPSQAVTRKNGASHVQVTAAAGSAPAETPVQTGISDGRRVEILSGLEEGQAVLVQDVRAADKSYTSSPLSTWGSRPRQDKKSAK